MTGKSAHLSNSMYKDLQIKANEIRIDIINMLVEAGSGHSAGPLDLADVFTALYFKILNNDPKNPNWDQRDRLFLSCGHVAPVLYATMAHAGYFSKEELLTLRKLGSRLQGHPERKKLPGLESTSGPLGSGLAQASGYAYAARMDDKKYKVYCVTSDGEHQEGNHWEAVAFAGKYKLTNLITIVDRNNIQISGFTEDVMPLEPLKAKYESFNWSVSEVDGHNIKEIVETIENIKEDIEKPTVVIAHTIAGKGVSFMEGKWEWHGKPPTAEESKEALKDLRMLEGKINSEK